MSARRATPLLVCLTLLLVLVSLSLLRSAGGESQRGQLRRSMAAPEPDAILHLHWVRQYPAPLPAWPDQPKLQFDVGYKPVLLGKTLLVGSSRTDSVTAIDSETGVELWRFFANGPVRFAPAAGQGRVYFTCDDGYLYCLDAKTGGLMWKFRGGPSERTILGNDRLISTWPARGGPVLADGTVYFAAGIWPFMGVFLHAVDATTGKAIWTNDGDGSTYTVQPHHAGSFGGIAPQGTLAIAGDKLLVPNGRSVPACYDRATGKQLHFRLSDDWRGGGTVVTAQGNIYLNGGAAFDLPTGDSLGPAGEPAFFADGLLYCCAAGECQTYDCKSIAARPSQRYSWSPWTMMQRIALPVSKPTCLIKSGARLYGAAADQVFAVDLPNGRAAATVVWQASIEGTPVHLLADGDRLFVSTRQGRLYCFGPDRVKPNRHPLPPASPAPSDTWTVKASAILRQTGANDGYCIAWGAGTGRLITELARQSKLRIIAIESDEERANAVRVGLCAEGLLADRVAIYVAPWQSVSLPPYLANLMVAEDASGFDAELTRKAFAALRPYGGVAYLPHLTDKAQAFHQQISSDATLVNAQVRLTADAVLMSRIGALPGSANWTHEHADAANTRVASDQLVKAPLGLLWFGGPSHAGVLPRHGHGPQPQVIDGRLIIEGADMLRAIDIYTGRLLWETKLPGVGHEFDELWHQPGANASGTNYISMADGIYVAYQNKCLRLDPATGALRGEFHFPSLLPGQGTGVRGNLLRWSYINVAGDYLVGGANSQPTDPRDRSRCACSSKHVVVMNRHTGQLLWTKTADSGYRHNTICIGGGRLYCIDRDNSSYTAWRRYSTDTSDSTARLSAFDLRTGKPFWSTASDVFGTWLSYSAKHDVLVEAGRISRDSLYDEADGMRAYRAANGTVMWHQPTYRGPAMIHGDMILKDKSACQVLTGTPIMRQDLLTGKPVEWTWTRDYGCNTPLASEHLLTFRSGAAGFFDLANDGGTGNFGGFRSGCTNNLIVAGGVLAAPDYTRTCTCSYQNQSSLALVPMPENEMWTYFGYQSVTGPVRRVGINFGAPGNRKSGDGTLWLEHPRAGGPSYRLPVTTVPENPEYFRRHPSWVKNGDGRWIGSSGVKGLTSVTVNLDPPPVTYYYSTSVQTQSEPAPKERLYTVRLHFIEPETLTSGERVFDVFVQGQQVLTDFNIGQQAGDTARVIVREFKGIKAARELTVTLTPAASAPTCEPVLCGIEIVAEGW
jgi:outer membrane protein assembly factor BamB